MFSHFFNAMQFYMQKLQNRIRNRNMRRHWLRAWRASCSESKNENGEKVQNHMAGGEWSPCASHCRCCVHRKMADFAIPSFCFATSRNSIFCINLFIYFRVPPLPTTSAPYELPWIADYLIKILHFNFQWLLMRALRSQSWWIHSSRALKIVRSRPNSIDSDSRFKLTTHRNT